MRKLAPLLAAFLVGCGSQSIPGLTWLTYVVKWDQVGSSPDYWLTKGSFGFDDRVALVFGYLSDADGCLDIAKALNAKYPAAMYSCRPAQ